MARRLRGRTGTLIRMSGHFVMTRLVQMTSFDEGDWALPGLVAEALTRFWRECRNYRGRNVNKK